MSINDKNNSQKLTNGINTIKEISNEFQISKNISENTESDDLVLNFFKTFSTYISSNKNSSQKIKFSPEFFDAKNDFNVAKIYEKEGKLYLKSFNYENEFDKFFTQVNKAKEQKRKTWQSLKKGSLEYKVPLYKTINLNELNNILYEDAILNSEIKYDVFNSIFFPENDRCLNKDNDLIFNLNLKMSHISKGILLFNEDSKNYMNIELEEINKKESDDINIDDNTNNNINTNINTNINNINESNMFNFQNIKNNKKSTFFKNSEIVLEIPKNNFVEEHISLFLLNISNYQNNQNYFQNNNPINTNIENIINNDKINIKDIIKSTDNTYLLDVVNHFNNIFTPKLYNKFSFYKNIKINNPSQFLNDINSELINDIENNPNTNTNNTNEVNKNNINNLDEEGENLMNDIKKYFDEELVKEINKDLEITQNFTHFYIEGNKFSKENMKKIVSFLRKENFYMFGWCYNKEETKKYGLVNNIIKVANLSNKIWFYINNKKTENEKQ